MTLDGSAEQTTAAKREGVGVEMCAKASGLAEWKTTIVLTRGRSILFEKFKISGFSLPPQPMLMKQRWHIVIVEVLRTSRLLVRIQQRKFSKLFGHVGFRDFRGRLKR